MRRKTIICLLAAALCALSAGCGAKPDGSSPSVPQSPPETQEPPASQAPSEAPEPPAPEPAPVQAPEPVSEPEPAPEEEAADLTGTWRDDQRGTSGGRCYMEITEQADRKSVV